MPANRLRELREEDGLSASELARRIDVHKSTIGRWETGKVQIPDEQKQKLAEMFKCSVAFLMGWESASENGEENGHDVPVVA